ncbi:C-C motif chemokine 3-like [Micropterus dolomieu]|uniref:C-C motif chemokine 3-like n=1 Tax=Micropterus dolomieu TaxID=147949 RepID=UPI001E8CAC3F|nr:C-C motif chemokine 3-like [Micropterus dolomieu]
MKTLYFTLGLLLLTACCCNAMPYTVNESSTGRCCFLFYVGRIWRTEIVNIFETHSSCRDKGFVVRTATGHEICVSLNLQWAQRAFNQQQLTDYEDY